MNVARKISEMKMENLHKKEVIDRLSRKIQKLKKKIIQLEELKPNSVVISVDGMRLYVGDEEIGSILENQEILNLNTNSINQKITFHGRTYVIRNLILTQKIGCVDELHIMAHDILAEMIKVGEANESKRY